MNKHYLEFCRQHGLNPKSIAYFKPEFFGDPGINNEAQNRQACTCSLYAGIQSAVKCGILIELTIRYNTINGLDTITVYAFHDNLQPVELLSIPEHIEIIDNN